MGSANRPVSLCGMRNDTCGDFPPACFFCASLFIKAPLCSMMRALSSRQTNNLSVKSDTYTCTWVIKVNQPPLLLNNIRWCVKVNESKASGTKNY